MFAICVRIFFKVSCAFTSTITGKFVQLVFELLLLVNCIFNGIHGGPPLTISVSYYNIYSTCISKVTSDFFLFTVDESIIFYGQAFYLRKQLNEWHFKFTIVKNLDAFTEVSMYIIEN